MNENRNQLSLVINSLLHMNEHGNQLSLVINLLHKGT